LIVPLASNVTETLESGLLQTDGDAFEDRPAWSRTLMKIPPTEAKASLSSFIPQLAAEAASPEMNRNHFVKFVDWKSLLVGLQKQYDQNIGEGILADSLTKPPYAPQFRTEIEKLTDLYS
jgi:hypothetical protein